MRVGDSRSLISAASREECACSDIDSDKLKAAWDVLLRDQIAKLKVSPARQPRMTRNSLQAVAEIPFVDRSLNPASFAIVVNRTQEGMKTPVLYTMLASASMFDRQGNASGSLNVAQSLDGIRRYRAALERIGIKRVFLAPRKCISWDQMTNMLTASIEVDRSQHYSNETTH
jgi:hypothetical protein